MIYLNDEAWTEALDIVNRMHDQSAENVRIARRRVEVAVRLVRFGSNTNGNAYTFAQFAEHGEIFYDGCTKMELLYDMYHCAYHGKNSTLTKNLELPSQLGDYFKRLISLMQDLHEFIHQMAEDEPSPKHGPRAKPYLHTSVRMLFEVWTELTEGRKFTIKEFVNFAHHCLSFANMGVTHTSVEESYKRHLRPRLAVGRVKKGHLEFSDGQTP